MIVEPVRTEEKRALAVHRLGRQRALARAVLLFERTWPAIWPPLAVAGAFLCAALLDLPPLLPPLGHLALVVGSGLAVAALLARGLWRVARPSEREADRRLERASGLHHRPLAVLDDKPALPGAEGLWAAHVARAVAQLGRLRVGWPRPGLAARDPLALRALLVVGLAACLVIAGSDAPRRVARALEPAWVAAPAPPATQVQAWITPPAYTGLAPLFLKNEGGAVSVPAGAHLTVSVTGGAGEPTLALAGTRHAFQALDAASYQADLELNSGGQLAVRRGGRELASWALTVVADSPPVVYWPEPPGVARGEMRVPQTRLPWQVSHEYGVTSLSAELHLRARPEAPALVLPIPLPGGSPKSAKGVSVQDLTAHPWAGLPVSGRLVARDAPGLAGTSDAANFVLPERRFQNPVARALMEVRKQLTLKPDDREAPVHELGELSALAGVWDNDAGGFLNLSAIASLLRLGDGGSVVEEAQSRLWELAIHLEEGATERTARALEQARQALREALDAQRRGEKIDQAEIERRMKELQDALQKHLQALAEEARRNPDSNQFDPNAHRLDAQEMQRLAEQMREAAREGRMDEASRDMAELEKLLDELKNARPDHGRMTERERQRAQQRQRGQQQMNALQDIVQRLGTLLDHADERTRPEPAPFERGLRQP
jgi:uncharacterized protein (TIGR02302 family)